jgi:hypothetical protein
MSCWFATAGVLAALMSPFPVQSPPSPVATAVTSPVPCRSGCAATCATRTQVIEQRLAQPVAALNFKDTPLKQVLSDLSYISGVNILPDVDALTEIGVDLNVPLSLEAENITLNSALNLLARKVHLATVVRDEVVMITAPMKCHGPMVQKVYPVADLMVSEIRFTAEERQQLIEAQMFFANGSRQVKRLPGTTREADLLKLIISTIAPQTWADSGGKGTAQYYPLGRSIVVNQTVDVQEQVADLLAALRRLHDMEVAVEVRLVYTSEALLEKLERKFQFSCEGPTDGKAPPTCFLDDAQVRWLMETAQGDRLVSIMKAPRMTLDNGQRGVLDITENYPLTTGFKLVEEDGKPWIMPNQENTRVGFFCAVQPAISADRRFVTIDVEMKQTGKGAFSLIPVTLDLPVGEGTNQDANVRKFIMALQRPQFSTVAVTSKAAVRDGGTVLMYAGKLVRETRTEFGPPVLSEIPYLNRFFRNVGYGKESTAVLLLVTPRIVVPQDEATTAARVFKNGRRRMEFEVIEECLPPIPRP